MSQFHGYVRLFEQPKHVFIYNSGAKLTSLGIRPEQSLCGTRGTTNNQQNPHQSAKWLFVQQEVGRWVWVCSRASCGCACIPLPIPKVCTSSRTNIHVVQSKAVPTLHTLGIGQHARFQSSMILTHQDE